MLIKKSLKKKLKKKKKVYQNSAKDRITHLNISVAVKRCSDNNRIHGTGLVNGNVPHEF